MQLLQRAAVENVSAEVVAVDTLKLGLPVMEHA